MFFMHYICTRDKKEKFNHQKDTTMKKMMTLVMMMTIFAKFPRNKVAVNLLQTY